MKRSEITGRVGLEHTAQPIRIAMQRQRLAEWPQGIEELLPVGIGENDVVAH